MFSTITQNNNNTPLREIELVTIPHKLTKSNRTTLRENTENEENNNKPVDAGKIDAGKIVAIPTSVTFRENTENEENHNEPVDAGKIGAIPTPAHVPSRRLCKFFPTDTRSFYAKDPITPLWWTVEEEKKTALQAEFDEALEALLSMIKSALPYISDDDECAYFIQRYRLAELNQHDSRLWEMIDEFGDDVEIIQENWMKFFDIL